MATLIAQFGAPQDITPPGFDGKVFRVPISAIEAQHIGTPRQASQTMNGCVIVEASDSLITVWKVSGSSLIKALFQIAKEHISSLLQNSGKVGDTKITVNGYTHPGPCPFDLDLIEEPNGAALKIDMARRIGFV